MTQINTLKGVLKFIDLVDYYHDTWTMRSHVL